jgi:hypothetical protein
VFSRRFRGSCRNPDEVHGTLMARRQFPIHFSVGTDPDKKGPTLPRDRPTIIRIRDQSDIRSHCRRLQYHRFLGVLRAQILQCVGAAAAPGALSERCMHAARYDAPPRRRARPRVRVAAAGPHGHAGAPTAVAAQHALAD